MSHSLTVNDLRSRNRAKVLRAVVLEPDTSRAGLALSLGLSPGTVTNVVGDLVREGLIIETGSVPSKGGRPIARLGAVRDAVYFIGADVGENSVQAAIFDLGLVMVDEVVLPLAARSSTPGQIRDAIRRAVSSLLEANTSVAERLGGIGLGLPGIVDTIDGETTVYAQSLGWEATPLADLTPEVGAPVFADNGAKTFAVAERWSGAAHGATNCLVVLVGRGVGAGVISGGDLLRGTSSSAGEWGHTKIVVNGAACACGGRGCVEAYVGGSALRARAHDAGLPVDATDERALADVIELSRKGNADAAGLLDEAIEYLGVGLANLVNIFNPETIVIGGWAGHLLFQARGEALADAVRRHSLTQPGERVHLTQSEASVDPIAFGAALLPLERFIDGNLPQEEQA